jgi:hypothetical protein
MLLLVHHPVPRERVARVRGHLRVFGDLGIVRVGPVEEVVLGHADRAVVGRHAEPARRRVRPLHCPVLLAVVEHAAGLEDEDLHAGHGELEGGHAAGGAAADDDDVPARAVGRNGGGQTAGFVGDRREIEVEGRIGSHGYACAFCPQCGQSLPSTVWQPTNSARI